MEKRSTVLEASGGRGVVDATGNGGAVARDKGSVEKRECRHRRY